MFVNYNYACIGLHVCMCMYVCVFMYILCIYIQGVPKKDPPAFVANIFAICILELKLRYFKPNFTGLKVDHIYSIRILPNFTQNFKRTKVMPSLVCRPPVFYASKTRNAI